MPNAAAAQSLPPQYTPQQQADAANRLVGSVRSLRFLGALDVKDTSPAVDVRAALWSRHEAWGAAMLGAGPAAAADLKRGLDVLAFLGMALLEPAAQPVTHAALANPLTTAASTMAGRAADALRQQWVRVFPEASIAAAMHARAAMQLKGAGDLSAARDRCLAAVAQDPYNVMLRELLDSFR